MTNGIRVAVVGTGFAGLAALKEFSQTGFEVTAFERYDTVSGIWAYNADPDVRSVSKNTLINNSKYMVNRTGSVVDDSSVFPIFQCRMVRGLLLY